MEEEQGLGEEHALYIYDLLHTLRKGLRMATSEGTPEKTGLRAGFLGDAGEPLVVLFFDQSEDGDHLSVDWPKQHETREDQQTAEGLK